MKLKLLSASCLALVFSSSAFAGMQGKLNSSSGHNDVVLPSEHSAALPPLHGSSDGVMSGSGSGYGAGRELDAAHTGSMMAEEMDDYAPLPSLHGSSAAGMSGSGSGYGAGRGGADAHRGSMMAEKMDDYAPLPSLHGSSAVGMPGSGSGYGAGRGGADAHRGSMMEEVLVKPKAPNRPLPATPVQAEPVADGASAKLDGLETKLRGKEMITKE